MSVVNGGSRGPFRHVQVKPAAYNQGSSPMSLGVTGGGEGDEGEEEEEEEGEVDSGADG